MTRLETLQEILKMLEAKGNTFMAANVRQEIERIKDDSHSTPHD